MKINRIVNYIDKKVGNKFRANLYKPSVPLSTDDINYYGKKIYSQNNEDGIIEYIFSVIGTTNKFFVEFGVGNGTECNTKYLLEKKGWNGLMMDGKENKNSLIKKEFITAENIEKLFEKHNVPKFFDLLSIDIDGNDYYVWKAIKNYYPRVVIMEYNSSYPPTESKSIKYEPKFKWDGTNYVGASLLSLVKLARQKGYSLLGCENNGVNAFFVKDDQWNEKFKKKDIEELYKPPQYGKIRKGRHMGHPQSKRKMIDV